MAMRAQARRRRARGAVLIEFVIVLPVFVLLLLASIDWGWYFVLRETAVNATREGARVGSAAPEGLWVPDATLAVRTYLTNSLGARHVQAPVVNVVPFGGYRAISVSLVDYPAGSITGFAATRVPTTLTATTVMRLEVQPP
jgi:Flp pilus assembly protein TadG